MKPSIGISLCILSFCAATAQAGIIWSDAAAFDAANPGLNLIDFEGISGPGQIMPVPAYPGVAFSGTNPVIADGPTNGAASDWLADNAFGGFIIGGFSPTVNAVGFNVATDGSRVGSGAIDGPARVTAYSGLDVLASAEVTTTTLDAFTTFVGFSGFGPITSIEVRASSFGDFANIDNVRYGTTVPEPATLALLGLGTWGLLVRRRRR